MQGSTYRCFLPDLTGFVDLHCIGPELSGISDNQIFFSRAPQSGIQPCYSGLQVQGTAGSPPSTTKVKKKGTLNYNGFNEKILVSVAVTCFTNI